RIFQFGFNPWSERARTIESLGTSPLRVGALRVPGSEVIGNRVSEDDIAGLFCRHVLADTSNDDGQLSFEGNLLRKRRKGHRFAVTDHRGIRLQEHQRLRRDLVAELLGVLTVGSAESDDLGTRNNRRYQTNVVKRVHGTGGLDALEERIPR